MKKYILVLLIALICFIPISVYAEDDSNIIEDKHNASFMVVDDYKFCGGTESDKALMKNIPSFIPTVTSSVYNTAMVVVPLILIIMGSLDLIKATTSQNEDEIKKGKTIFLKRLIIGIMTFLVVLFTKFIVSALADQSTNGNRIIDCIDCFVSNDCGKMSLGKNPQSNS